MERAWSLPRNEMARDPAEVFDAEIQYAEWEFSLPKLVGLQGLAFQGLGEPTVPASQYGTSLPAKVIADLARERAAQQFAPIDVEAVLAVHRMQLHRIDLPKELAYVLFTYKRRVAVAVSSTDPAIYQRFSLAHALGFHLAGPEVLIHLQFIRLQGPAIHPTRQERATEFAATLLMPEFTLRDDVEGMVARSPISANIQPSVRDLAVVILRLRESPSPARLLDSAAGRASLGAMPLSLS